MKTSIRTIPIATDQRNVMLDVTARVARIVAGSGVQDGIVTVYCPHTTAAITINENADPTVPGDILMMLGELVPHRHRSYRHGEGNSDAHCKSSMLGCAKQIIIADGVMQLGTWQGIFFCEFDGPRSRKMLVQLMGE